MLSLAWGSSVQRADLSFSEYSLSIWIVFVCVLHLAGLRVADSLEFASNCLTKDLLCLY